MWKSRTVPSFLESELRYVNETSSELSPTDSSLEETPHSTKEDIVPILQNISPVEMNQKVVLAGKPERSTKITSGASSRIAIISSDPKYQTPDYDEDIKYLSQFEPYQLILGTTSEGLRVSPEYIMEETLDRTFDSLENKLARMPTQPKHKLDLSLVLSEILNDVFEYTKEEVSRRVRFSAQETFPKFIAETLHTDEVPTEDRSKTKRKLETSRLVPKTKTREKTENDELNILPPEERLAEVCTESSCTSFENELENEKGKRSKNVSDTDYGENTTKSKKQISVGDNKSTNRVDAKKMKKEKGVSSRIEKFDERKDAESPFSTKFYKASIADVDISSPEAPTGQEHMNKAKINQLNVSKMKQKTEGRQSETYTNKRRIERKPPRPTTSQPLEATKEVEKMEGPLDSIDYKSTTTGDGSAAFASKQPMMKKKSGVGSRRKSFERFDNSNRAVPPMSSKRDTASTADVDIASPEVPTGQEHMNKAKVKQLNVSKMKQETEGKQSETYTEQNRIERKPPRPTLSQPLEASKYVENMKGPLDPSDYKSKTTVGDSAVFDSEQSMMKKRSGAGSRRKSFERFDKTNRAVPPFPSKLDTVSTADVDSSSPEVPTGQEHMNKAKIKQLNVSKMKQETEGKQSETYTERVERKPPRLTLSQRLEATEDDENLEGPLDPNEYKSTTVDASAVFDSEQTTMKKKSSAGSRRKSFGSFDKSNRAVPPFSSKLDTASTADVDISSSEVLTVSNEGIDDYYKSSMKINRSGSKYPNGHGEKESKKRFANDIHILTIKEKDKERQVVRKDHEGKLKHKNIRHLDGYSVTKSDDLSLKISPSSDSESTTTGYDSDVGFDESIKTKLKKEERKCRRKFDDRKEKLWTTTVKYDESCCKSADKSTHQTKLDPALNTNAGVSPTGMHIKQKRMNRELCRCSQLQPSGVAGDIKDEEGELISTKSSEKGCNCSAKLVCTVTNFPKAKKGCKCSKKAARTDSKVPDMKDTPRGRTKHEKLNVFVGENREKAKADESMKNEKMRKKIRVCGNRKRKRRLESSQEVPISLSKSGNTHSKFINRNVLPIILNKISISNIAGTSSPVITEQKHMKRKVCCCKEAQPAKSTDEKDDEVQLITIISGDKGWNCSLESVCDISDILSAYEMCECSMKAARTELEILDIKDFPKRRIKEKKVDICVGGNCKKMKARKTRRLKKTSETLSITPNKVKNEKRKTSRGKVELDEKFSLDKGLSSCTTDAKKTIESIDQKSQVREDELSKQKLFKKNISVCTPDMCPEVVDELQFEGNESQHSRKLINKCEKEACCSIVNNNQQLSGKKAVVYEDKNIPVEGDKLSNQTRIRRISICTSDKCADILGELGAERNRSSHSRTLRSQFKNWASKLIPESEPDMLFKCTRKSTMCRSGGICSATETTQSVEDHRSEHTFSRKNISSCTRNICPEIVDELGAGQDRSRYCQTLPTPFNKCGRGVCTWVDGIEHVEVDERPKKEPVERKRSIFPEETCDVTGERISESRGFLSFDEPGKNTNEKTEVDVFGQNIGLETTRKSFDGDEIRKRTTGVENLNFPEEVVEETPRESRVSFSPIVMTKDLSDICMDESTARMADIEHSIVLILKEIMQKILESGKDLMTSSVEEIQSLENISNSIPGENQNQDLNHLAGLLEKIENLGVFHVCHDRNTVPVNFPSDLNFVFTSEHRPQFEISIDQVVKFVVPLREILAKLLEGELRLSEIEISIIDRKKRHENRSGKRTREIIVRILNYQLLFETEIFRRVSLAYGNLKMTL